METDGVATVELDRLMVALQARHPGYEFAAHKGYPMPGQLAGLARLGHCQEHRRSFAPVRRRPAPGLFDV